MPNKNSDNENAWNHGNKIIYRVCIHHHIFIIEFKTTKHITGVKMLPNKIQYTKIEFGMFFFE